MPDLLQIENIKLVLLFVLIASVIAMSRFGSATPGLPETRRNPRKPVPAGH